MRLTSTNMLMTGIQINQLIRDMEVEAGQVSSSAEDAELEEDDG
jgi:hypothetical protein